MAAYPALPQFVGTKFTPRFGVQERVARNGSIRFRMLQSAPKYDITIYHDVLTQSQRDTLISFYNTNRILPITFTADEDGITRTMYFAGQGYVIEPREPFVVGGVASPLYRATVFLRDA